MPTHKSNYRSEIDGLRAFAVIAVIINHVDKNLLPSGFLGVDIFFVISGFVITSSLSSIPHQSFRVFFGSFIERRIKRLLPALALCIIVTSFFTCYLDPSPDTSLRTGIFALFGLSNIYLLSSASDYFAQATEANAFTQTWSLGVEEQFYLFFPAIVWVTRFLSSPTGSRNFGWVISVLSITSLTGYWIINKTNPNAAFYLMPTRFWELGFGCLLHLFLKRLDKKHVTFFLKNESVIYVLLLIALIFSPKSISAPATVLTALLTLLLIATSKPGTYLHVILNSPVVQYIGKISYSLYLWHWSVLCISRWLVGTHALLAPFLLFLIFSLAALSYHFVERPFRFSMWSSNRGKSILLGLTASLGIAVILLLLAWQHKMVLREHQNYIELPPAHFAVKNTGLPYNPTCVVDGDRRLLTLETFDNCTVPPKKRGGQTIWTLGDSHAGHLQGLLYSIHEKTGLGVHLIETPGITFPLNIAEFEPRQVIFNEIMSRAKDGDIILVSRLFIDRTTHTPYSDLPEWGQKISQLASQLNEKGLKLVVVGPPPIFQYEHIESCYFSIFGLNPCVVERFSISSNVNNILSLLNEALRKQKNAYVFDSFEQLCPDSNLTCSPIADNKFLFRDKDHLNTHGAAALTVSFIDFMQKKGLLIEGEGVWNGL